MPVLGHAVATTLQQQPKPDAQDEQGKIEQHSGNEQKPDVAPLRFIEQLVDSRAFRRVSANERVESPHQVFLAHEQLIL